MCTYVISMQVGTRYVHNYKKIAIHVSIKTRYFPTKALLQCALNTSKYILDRAQVSRYSGIIIKGDECPTQLADYTRLVRRYYTCLPNIFEKIHCRVHFDVGNTQNMIVPELIKAQAILQYGKLVRQAKRKKFKLRLRRRCPSYVVRKKTYLRRSWMLSSPFGSSRTTGGRCVENNVRWRPLESISIFLIGLGRSLSHT